MNKPRIYQDTRWSALVERYANDLAAFAADVLGIEVTPALFQAFTIAAQPGARLSLASHLDRLDEKAISPVAPIAIWRLFCRPDSYTLVAIPLGSIRQRRRQYTELLESVANGRYGWLCEYVTFEQDKLHLGSRYSGAQVRFLDALEGSPEQLAGCTRRDLYWLLEDAHHIPDVCFRVSLSTLTDPGASMAISGHVEVTTGFAFVTRNDRSKPWGGTWDVATIDSPLVMQSTAKSV